ncbi:MAG TPA: serine/threonine-protein kinase [Phycisphaerales bacterium]|nr:serine/threonine-protein kinase [Phycisphaerales bacterium]
MITHVPEDAFASILVDMARSAEIAPRMLPEDFGPAGRYRLEELVGIGHDSHVYRAVDTHLSKPTAPAYVAVKIRASGASARSEALVGRSVAHEHVVRVLDHGLTDDGESYVVQEWISGGDLADVRPPLSAREAARLVESVARGVQALHSAGNIHGDLKPSNILRTEQGLPKITDFDLASATDLSACTSGGNLALMAPERLLAQRSSPTPLADIYALGGLLYYFVTGKLPHGDRPEEIVARHRSRASVVVDGLDPDLAAICLHALAPDPADRYRSAEALADDLHRWLARLPILWTRPSLTRRARLLLRRRPIPVTISSLALVASMSIAGWVQVLVRQDIEAQRQANELAAAKNEADRLAIERVQADMREGIQAFIKSGVVQRQKENTSSLFPALVWVDWIADSGLLEGMGGVMLFEDRIAALSDLRAHYRKSGQTGTLPDKLAAYCLAYVHLEAEQIEAASQYISDAREGIISTLAENDDLRRSLEAMHMIVEFERAVRGARVTDAEQLRARMTGRRAQLLAIDGTHPVADLIDLAFERHPD